MKILIILLIAFTIIGAGVGVCLSIDIDDTESKVEKPIIGITTSGQAGVRTTDNLCMNLTNGQMQLCY